MIDDAPRAAAMAPSGQAPTETATGAGRRIAALIRHGHFPRPENVASGHLPIPLSEEGRAQAARAATTVVETAERLGVEIDPRIEASSLLRAHQTATILAEALAKQTGEAFEVDDRDELLERGLGSCANLRFEEIEAVLAKDPRLSPLPRGWRRVPDFRLPVPGAESLLQAGRRTAARIDASLAAIPPEASDRMRLFVAHGGCLRHAAVVKDVLARDRAPRVTMAHAQVVCFERLPDGAWQLAAGDWKPRDLEKQGPGGGRANEEPEG